MDTLASLALATEKPIDALLLRQPHRRHEYLITSNMIKHILIQAFYQLIVVFVMLFAGEYFLPEFSDNNEFYRNSDFATGTVRSGRAKL
mmetsp:Transcript_11652/g.5836  ORF Transcript_11652/g.5836 Transcript_11652/m.5836 type:complete len:89 (-) Transcript_11652:58-324(-)